jgi:glutamate 5-kinase
MKFRRIVIKIGSSTLTAGSKQISPAHMLDLVREVCILVRGGAEVVLVSSGAIAAGRETLGFPELPRLLPAKQMLAAIGQPRLMAIYEQFFGIYDVKVAQVLLTRADLTDRRRYLNARNTLDALVSQRVIPIINENDTVATEEIRFGDNDNLSAQVANLIEADLLVLLTDQEGLYTTDPRQNPQAELVREINTPEIPREIWLSAGGTANGIGTGGMLTKLQAADLARRGGTTVVIASGKDAQNISRIVQKERKGTWIKPSDNHLEARKRYILAGGAEPGRVIVDAGAEKALIRGSSLLPAGIIKVSGEFDRGDTIHIQSAAGVGIALGLANYSDRDLLKCAGHQSNEIENLLGFTYGDEAVHRNNLVMLEKAKGASDGGA